MAALEASIGKSRSTEETAPAAPVAETSQATASNHEQQSFEGMSKAELLAKAKDLRVEVNSRMTKPQLVQALADAQPAPKKRSRKAS
jgi:hypothetical protein